MRRNIFFSLFLMASAPLVKSQTVNVSQDNANFVVQQALNEIGTGRPFVSARFTQLVEGTPYFRENWMPGIVELASGPVNGATHLKVDLFDNTLHYLHKGLEMVATSPVMKVQLTDTTTGQTYLFWNQQLLSDSLDNSMKGWYRVLQQGATTLLVRYRKTVIERQPYGSATTEMIIRTSNIYYILQKGTITEVKKWKDLPGLLSKPDDAVNAYIKEHKLNGKTEEDYKKLVEWDNKQ
jgi:hypothetical protein